ncbi:peptide chain release factor [Actinoplanes tereljensis]|uniref:Peptide chain release factor-like protein n=1 Tax=Paractinoplanes tereljensis TaxID=571912 RepID=A0A919NVB5_9ACTN|nr:peptide chain release factor-like protein [Actinoplanes tereljensis]GIF25936.1 peptide chain release factor-like protein [Actinoplanes tereljensis]
MTVHLLMSAGRGPQECAWAVSRLVLRLEAAAADPEARPKVKRPRSPTAALMVDRLESVPGERAGTFRSVLLRIDGPGAEAFAAGWTGTLCWQAPSPYRKVGRKNWYVISEPCEVEVPSLRFAEADIDFVAVRTGGPGGQHRNKASTAVRATHRPTGFTVVADTERYLSQNRRIAIGLLREKISRGIETAAQAAVTARWQVHDNLVRGNPVRIERGYL